MKPKLDQFFIDVKYGRLKLSGYDEKAGFMFSTYEKLSGPDWVESKHSLVLSPSQFQIRYEQGVLKESFPPI